MTMTRACGMTDDECVQELRDAVITSDIAVYDDLTSKIMSHTEVAELLYTQMIANNLQKERKHGSTT